MMLRALPRAAAGIAASLALQQTCQQSDDRLARWRKRWEGDTRGWELGKTVHPRLAEFEERLLPEPSRVLIPLAGQSHDVAHLAWRGHSVVAVEGVPAALEAFKATYGADEARRIAGHACDDYDGPDVASALATMHIVKIPAPEGGSKRLTWHAGDFLGNFSCPLVDAAWASYAPLSFERPEPLNHVPKDTQVSAGTTFLAENSQVVWSGPSPSACWDGRSAILWRVGASATSRRRSGGCWAGSSGSASSTTPTPRPSCTLATLCWTTTRS